LAHSHSPRQIEGRARRGGCLSILIALFVLFFLARFATSWTIDYQWWKEMGQLRTWFSMLAYSVIPTLAATLIGFAVFWIAHARALKRAGTGLRHYPLYAKLSTLAIFLLALAVASATLDTWTVVRYFGGKDIGGAAAAWHDPAFGNPLAFYLFKIPFYSDLLGLVLGIVVIAGLIYWIADRVWEVRLKVADWSNIQDINISQLGLGAAFQSKFFRAMGAVFLLALAVRFFLGRYNMLLDEHGSFMVGIDYVDQYVALPLQWVLIASAVLSAAALLAGKWRIALLLRWFLYCAAWFRRSSLPYMSVRTKSPSSGRSSSVTLPPRDPRTVSTSAPRKSTFKPSPSKRSTWPNTSPCSTMFDCGIGTRFTIRYRSFSRIGCTPIATLMWTATPSTARCVK
jgi:uncharacterized membrane protein (UPF0182 family)